jgi:Pyridoxamine 5'-phosphate oxidase
MPPARPHLPSEYGVPADADGMLPWEFVEERMAAAPNYWVTTVGPVGAPHARPIDGVWVEGALCFGGSPKTRWVRNLQSNAQMSVHLPHDDEVVILEGTAELVTDAAHPLAKPTAQAQRAKYPQYYGDVADDAPFRPFWMLRPATVYAWSLSGFPGNVTSWRLR